MLSVTNKITVGHILLKLMHTASTEWVNLSVFIFIFINKLNVKSGLFQKNPLQNFTLPNGLWAGP